MTTEQSSKKSTRQTIYALNDVIEAAQQMLRCLNGPIVDHDIRQHAFEFADNAARELRLCRRVARKNRRFVAAMAEAKALEIPQEALNRETIFKVVGRARREMVRSKSNLEFLKASLSPKKGETP